MDLPSANFSKQPLWTLIDCNKANSEGSHEHHRNISVENDDSQDSVQHLGDSGETETSSGTTQPELHVVAISVIREIENSHFSREDKSFLLKKS